MAGFLQNQPTKTVAPAVTDQAFPRLDTQAVDPKTGQWTKPWYRFMISMWNRTGGGSGYDIASIMTDADAALFEEMMGDVQPDTLTQRMIGLFSAGDSEPVDPPVPGILTLALPASPAAIAARMTGTLYINGGTVSALSLLRGSTTVTLPANSPAIVPMSTGDTVSLTYTGTPTLTFIPR